MPVLEFDPNDESIQAAMAAQINAIFCGGIALADSVNAAFYSAPGTVENMVEMDRITEREEPENDGTSIPSADRWRDFQDIPLNQQLSAQD